MEKPEGSWRVWWWLVLLFVSDNSMSIILIDCIHCNYWHTIIANKQQYQPSPNPPRSFWFFHSLPLFISPSIYSLLLFITSIDFFLWHKRYGRLTVKTHIFLWFPENHMHFSEDKLVIAIVSDDLPYMLLFSNSSPDCNNYLLYCGNFLIKCYLYLLYI